MRPFDLAIAEAWAIEEGALLTILGIAEREIGDLRAVEARRAERLDGAHDATIRNGVAVLPVIGPIFRYANLFTEISGATSVQMLARDFTTAMENRDVRAVLLSIDSPGGTVNGTNELAKMIFAARGRKPIAAYVSHVGASGAYWIASAADQVFADDTAMVGSIGVVMAGLDTRERDRARGVNEIRIVSSQSPRKDNDPTTDEGRAVLQARVDALAEVFIESVARHRGVDPATVRDEFGQGDVLIGRQAAAAGMIDGIATFEDTLAALAGAGPFAPLGRDVHHNAKGRQIMTTKATTTLDPRGDAPAPVASAPAPGAPTPAPTRDTIAQDHPQVAEALRREGAEAALKAERERIAAIEAKMLPGYEKIAAEFKANGRPVGEYLAALVEAQQQDAGKRRETTAAEGAALDKLLPPAAAVGAVPAAPAPTDDPEAAKAAAEKTWAADATLQAEFGGDKAAFLAYRDAERKGKIHRFGAPRAA